VFLVLFAGVGFCVLLLFGVFVVGVGGVASLLVLHNNRNTVLKDADKTQSPPVAFSGRRRQRRLPRVRQEELQVRDPLTGECPTNTLWVKGFENRTSCKKSAERESQSLITSALPLNRRLKSAEPQLGWTEEKKIQPWGTGNKLKNRFSTQLNEEDSVSTGATTT